MTYRIISFSVLFFVSFLQANAQSANRMIFDNTWNPRVFNVPEKSIRINLPEIEVNDQISVFTCDTLAPVLPVHLGLNTTFRSGGKMVNERMENYRRSGMGAFRFPAGSGSNIYFWDGQIPDNFLIDISPIDGTSGDALKIEDFVKFIDSLDAEATIVVNYFYARYGVTPEGTRASRVNQAAAYAAGFVHYVNNVLKAGVKNWEVGNECYGKWEEGYDVNGSIVTGKEYGQDFCVFAEKMKTADPSIKIGAVMWPKDDEWNDEVMKEVKNHADFLIVHNYFTTEQDATIENIISSTPQVNEIKTQMENCILRNTQFPRDHFPVAMTEYNCRGPHTTTFVNACFTADVIGRLIESKYGLATRWVGEWAWKPGTHGLFALNDPDQADYTPRQAYFVYRYFAKAFGDHMVRTNSEIKELKFFASQFQDGKTGLMVINPTDKEITYNLDIRDTESGNFWLYEIYANSLEENDKKFFVNEVTSETKGGGPDILTEVFPYEGEFNRRTLFNARKYSVSFYVFNHNRTTGLFQNQKIKKLIIYPNPSREQILIKDPLDFQRLEIFSFSGDRIHCEKYKSPIDVSFLSKGKYILKLNDWNNAFYGHFLIQ